MLKKSFIIIALSSILLANSFNLNDKLVNFTLSDQFDKIHTIDTKIKTIIVSFEKDTGSQINQFLDKKEATFLDKNSAVFIANISGMPTIITKMFALPKMKKYKHPILLIYDESDSRFLQKEGYSTVYKIEKGLIKNISYVKDDNELEEVFK